MFGVFILTRTASARNLLLLGAGLSFVAPVWAQNAALDSAATTAATAPLQAALSAGNTPLSLSISALDGSWRRFKINKSLDSNFKVAPETEEDSATYSYLTRGETTKVGDETFLIAYRTRVWSAPAYNVSGEDYATNTANADDYLSPNFLEDSEALGGYLRLLPTQTLRLCLFNVRTVGDLGDIRAFDAKADVVKIVTAADKAQAADQAIAQRAKLTGNAINNRVDTDLKQIGLALTQYTQDYDEKLPPMRSSQSMADIRKYDGKDWDSPPRATVQQVLTPYMKSNEIFAHPTTREIYRPNINISGRSLAKLETSPEQVIAFYEAAPAPDGTRAVLYLDGHVRREPETNWANVQAISARFAPPLNFGKRANKTANSTGTTVTLHDAAAKAYQIKQWRKDPRHTQTLYLSKSTNRVYYRDDKTKQAIWVDPPAKGVTLPIIQAAPFRDYKGYNGQTTGRLLVDDFKIK